MVEGKRMDEAIRPWLVGVFGVGMYTYFSLSRRAAEDYTKGHAALHEVFWCMGGELVIHFWIPMLKKLFSKPFVF